MIYDIDSRIEALIDPETGEITDFEALEALYAERGALIESLALLYKNYTAKAEAIRSEMKSLLERGERAERQAQRIKERLSQILAGDKFESAKVSIGFRKSSKLIIDEAIFFKWADSNQAFIRQDTIVIPDKRLLHQAVKRGESIPGVTIVENNNIQIK